MSSESPQKVPAPTRARRLRLRVVWVVLGVLVLVVGASRIALPGVIREQAQAALDRNREYDGTLGAVQLSLWRGSYALEDVTLNHRSDGRRVPFIQAERIALSFGWSALLRGRLVGEIVVERPIIQFVDDGSGGGSDIGGGGGAWVDSIEGLFPFRLDRGELRDGRVHFRAPYADPPVDLALTRVQCLVENLTNVHDRLQPYFATVEATAIALDHAQVDLRMTLDPSAYRPSFAMALRLLDLDVTEANSLSRAYANLDFHGGRFDLVVELNAQDGQLDGYVKPLFRDLVVFELSDLVEQDPLTAFWNALIGLVTSVLENPPTDQFGTLIPLEGRLDDPAADFISTLGNVLRNAFVRAFLPTVETDGPAAQGLVFGRGTPL